MSLQKLLSILESPVVKLSLLTINCCLISNCAALYLYRKWEGMASNSIYIASGVFLAQVIWLAYMLLSKKEIKTMTPAAGRFTDNCNTLLFFYYMACLIFRSLNNMPMVWVSWAILAVCLIVFILSGRSRSEK